MEVTNKRRRGRDHRALIDFKMELLEISVRFQNVLTLNQSLKFMKIYNKFNLSRPEKQEIILNMTYHNWLNVK